MAFFILKKKQTQGIDDCEQLSALGDDPKPKVVPRIFEFWKDPEAFRGMVG
jgi:hypothetical protein